jgi:hypothetical protein
LLAPVFCAKCYTHCSEPGLAGPVEHPQRLATLLAACVHQTGLGCCQDPVLCVMWTCSSVVYLVRGSCSGRNALSGVTEPKTACQPVCEPGGVVLLLCCVATLWVDSLQMDAERCWYTLMSVDRCGRASAAEKRKRKMGCRSDLLVKLCPNQRQTRLNGQKCVALAALHNQTLQLTLAGCRAAPCSPSRH